MARKAATPAPAPPTGPTPAPKPHPLDWSHKLILPALAILVSIVVGSFTVYFGLAKLAADKDVERLKAEVKQHEEQEQRAKDDAQWLRVEIAKDRQREKMEQDEAAKVNKNDGKARAQIAVKFALLRVGLDALPNAEAEKFGEEVKDLWEKAVKKAAEDVKKETANPWSALL